MTDTCGLTSCEPFAKWDHDSQCWKTSEVTSLWALTLSSLTLPQWGGLHNGELCEHPTPEPVTSGHDCSSLPTPAAIAGASDLNFQVSGDGRTKPNKLGWAIGEMLPTPTVDDSKQVTRASGAYQSLTRSVTMLPTPRAQVHDENPETFLPRQERVQQNPKRTGGPTGMPLGVAVALLPTPAVNDMSEGKTLEWWDDWAPRQKAADGRPAPHGRSLAIEAQRLLPTPTTQHSSGGYNPDWGHGMTLLDAAKEIVEWTGPTTRQPFTDGKQSSTDPHQHQLSLDELALPA